MWEPQNEKAWWSQTYQEAYGNGLFIPYEGNSSKIVKQNNLSLVIGIWVPQNESYNGPGLKYHQETYANNLFRVRKIC